MSLEMTFRQKLVRIACSSAICGISLSFLFGESVDQKAKLLRSWTPDYELIPLGYEPLRPIAQAVERIQPDLLQANLVAVNSLPSSVASTKVLFPRGVPALPAFAPKDEVVVLAAAPVVELPAVMKEPPPAILPEETVVRPGEAVILGEKDPSAAKMSEEKSGGIVISGAAPQPESKRVLKTPSSPSAGVVVAESEALPDQPQRHEPRTRLAALEAGWTIEGQILASTDMNLDSGHFEVGLFAKKDADGNPVGFPLVQQILPAGKRGFRLHISSKIESGYLFGEYVAKRGNKRHWLAPASNPWKRGKRELAELFLRPEDTVTSTAAATQREAARDSWRIQGQITTMFSPSGAPIPQEDVVIKVRGRKESARSDSKGNFALDLPRARGTIFLEILKAGFHPTILGVSADDNRPLNVMIASRHAVDQIAQRLNISQVSAKGVFLGRAVGSDGSGLRGVTAQLSLKADGPFYFDDDGKPSREPRGTGSDGRFLFLNVEPGVAYVDTAVNGEPVAPFQISTVEGGELVQKVLQPVSGAIKGRLFNPVTAAPKLSPVSGARVRVEGSTDYVTTDSFGAFSIGPLRWIKGERITVEFSAEKFNNHRYFVNADSQTNLNLYAFPASYVSRLAESMDVDIDPYAGIVIGKVSGLSVRVDALADHSVTNSAKDFYFDSRGHLRGSHEMTDSRFGTYMILNVPKGRAILQGSDSSGSLRYSESVHSSPSSISVVMD